MIKILIAAGIGGTLPTLCRLAAAYSVNPDQPVPAIGSYIAIGLFFLIGMAVAFGFDESQLRKAFALGIAGPGIVTSIFSGVSQTHAPVKGPVDPSTINSVGRVFGIADSYAGPLDIRLAQAPTAASTSASVVRSQLTVIPTLTGKGIAPQGIPIELRFLGNGGNTLAVTPVSPSLTTTVNVPAGASALRASITGTGATVQLPTAFQSALLRLSMTAAASNDFLWALGSGRESTITTLSAAITNVTAMSEVNSSQKNASPTDPSLSAAITNVTAASEVNSRPMSASPTDQAAPPPSTKQLRSCSSGKIKERTVTALVVGSDTTYVYILKQRITPPQYADAYFFPRKPWPDEAISAEQFHHRIKALSSNDYFAQHVRNGDSVSLRFDNKVKSFSLKMHQTRSFADGKICLN